MNLALAEIDIATIEPLRSGIVAYSRRRVIPLRAFEPLRREQYENPTTKSYVEALPNRKPATPVRWRVLQPMLGNMLMSN
jgi:hypothetical protein